MRITWHLGAGAIMFGTATVLMMGPGGERASAEPADGAGEGSCAADVDGDGTIGTADLLRVIDAWATEGTAPADVNGDAVVDQGDLVEVIVSWGACPHGADDDGGGVTGGAMHVCAFEGDGLFETADGGCKDLATGLVWGTCNMMGACTGGVTWQAANEAVSASNEGGYSDWRLPTIEELQTVLANGAQSHFAPMQIGSRYTSEKNGNWAWTVSFWDGTAAQQWVGKWNPSYLLFIGVREAGGPPPAGCNDDGVCDPGEDCESCDDCAGVTNGPPSGRFCCGNGEVEGPEGDGTICDGNF